MLLSRISRWADEQSRRNPWTNVYGTARTLIALGSLLTLVLSHTRSLFSPAADRAFAVGCEGYATASLFCRAGVENLEVARWIAVLVLLLVVVGWRPRFTGVLHWYVAWSFMVSATIVDGGDQVAAILALLLVPVTLTDPRRWHWSRAAGVRPPNVGGWLAVLVALSSLVVIRIQVAAIYFHSTVGKLGVEEWIDGTVLYYWFTHSYFGAPAWLRPLVWVFLDSALLLPLVTWGVLALEAFLFAGLIADRRYWQPLLVMGISMHLGIALVHGIVSFSTIMFGALILYLRPFDREFPVPARLRRRPARQVRALAAPAPSPRERSPALVERPA